LTCLCLYLAPEDDIVDPTCSAGEDPNR
jgi:hypothetical protein